MTSPDQRDRQAAPPGAHARHDTFLVAAHAAGDLSDASLRAVEAQLATCSACSALYDDLRAIAGATKSLSRVTIPASAAGRDFRLTPEDAARLNRGRGWRRLLQPLAGSGAAWTRPFATAMTTIGLAGILMTTVLPSLGGLASSGGTASMPQERLSVGVPTAAPMPEVAQPAPAGAPETGAPDAGAGAVGATGGPSAAIDAMGPDTKASQEAPGGDSTGRNVAGATAAPAHTATEATPPAIAAGQAPATAQGLSASSGQDGMAFEELEQGPSPSSLLPIASAVLVALGVVLLGLRFVARRYT